MAEFVLYGLTGLIGQNVGRPLHTVTATLSAFGNEEVKSFLHDDALAGKYSVELAHMSDLGFTTRFYFTDVGTATMFKMRFC